MKNIILYVSGNCIHCHVCIKYLLEKGVIFEVKDIIQNKEALNELKQKNILSVPTLFVGDNYTIGFNREKIECLLKSESED